MKDRDTETNWFGAVYTGLGVLQIYEEGINKNSIEVGKRLLSMV